MTERDPSTDPGNPKDTSALFADLSSMHEGALAFIDKAQLLPSNKVGKRAVQLFTRIVELAGGCLALHAANIFTPVPIVARSSVEAIADLLALQKDPAHLDSIDARNLNQDYKLWTDDVALTSDVVKRGLEHPTAAEDLEWLKSKRKDLLERLKNRKAAKATLSIKELFEDAGIEQFYAVQYNRLCVEAHNNATSLTERHVAIDPASGKKVPVYYKGPTQATEMGLTAALACLETALASIALLFGKQDVVQSLSKGA
jgi:hypothetical protein